MSEKTMVSLFKTTTEELLKLKIHKRESYDDIIQRLIEFYNNNKKE